MVVKLPLRVKASGFLTLGPRPGTPEFSEEQAARAEGRTYDYSKGRKLYIEDEKTSDDNGPLENEPATLRAVDDVPPPCEGFPG